MTDKHKLSMELMHDLLKTIRGDILEIKSSQISTNERLSSVEHHLHGIYTTQVNSSNDLDRINTRLKSVENRLGLVDIIEQ